MMFNVEFLPYGSAVPVVLGQREDITDAQELLVRKKLEYAFLGAGSFSVKPASDDQRSRGKWPSTYPNPPLQITHNPAQGLNENTKAALNAFFSSDFFVRS